MLSLKDRQWGEFRVGDLFDFTRGKRITTAFSNENPGDIPVISGGEYNNGVLCYINHSCKDSKVLLEKYITVASYGSAGCVHYQPKEFFLNDSVIALRLKDEKVAMNDRVNLFMVTVLSTLSGGYSYGRGVTIDRYRDELIGVPITPTGDPDYEFMEQYIREREPDYSWVPCSAISGLEAKLSDANWKEFRIGDIFEQERGKEKAPKQNLDGEVPLIVETDSNNGLLKMAEPTRVFKGNAISVSINVPKNVFYQPVDFCASVNIAILRNEHLNKYNGLFVSSIISFVNQKYNYGNKQSKDRLNNTIIKLPATPDSNPDWKFMESYVRERESLICMGFREILLSMKG